MEQLIGLIVSLFIFCWMIIVCARLGKIKANAEITATNTHIIANNTKIISEALAIHTKLLATLANVTLDQAPQDKDKEQPQPPQQPEWIAPEDRVRMQELIEAERKYQSKG
jgi:hypothetical protein